MRSVFHQLSKILLLVSVFGVVVLLQIPAAQASGGDPRDVLADSCKAYYGNVCTQWWGDTSAPRSMPAVNPSYRDSRCSSYYGTTCTRYYNETTQTVPSREGIAVNGIPLNDPSCRAYQGTVCTQWWGDSTGYVYPQVPYSTVDPYYYYGSWYYPTYYYAPWYGNNSYWGW